jgi:hypothetical protein
MEGMTIGLIKAWREQKWNKRPYVLTNDADILSQKIRCFTSYDDYTASSDFPNHHRSHFHVGLVPVPFHGDLETADTFICLINPGLNILDYYAEDNRAYRRLLLLNLRQKLASDPYPFFPLDPKWRWTSSGKWWSDLFANIIDKLRDKKPSATYADAAKFVSKRIASLELIPYHSFDSGHAAKLTKELESSILIRNFVEKKILHKAHNREALLVIASGANKWNIKKGLPNVVYQPPNHRKAHFSMKPRGSGSKILQWLLRSW